MDQSRMTSLPAARSGMHSSRRLSSNGSLSELGLLEHSQPQEQQQRRSSSGGRSINSSSSKSSTISSSPSSNINMMKKLGSKFTLKRNRDGSTSTSTSTDDAVEELADEDQVLATARPRNGRILTSSTASNASRQSGVYGDLTQSDTGVNRLRHRTSISNLNASINSNASVSSVGGNSSVQRQQGQLRHRASISSLSGSESGTLSPPTTALRQPGTLRHRSSISNLSGSSSTFDITTTSPPSTAIRKPGTLRHRSSISSLSSVAGISSSISTTKPSSSRQTQSSTSNQIPPSQSRVRTMSTTAASTSRPFSKISNDVSNTSIVNTSLSNSRRLSATHTGLSTVARTRTTSLMSPPKAAGGLSRPNPSMSSTNSTSASSTSSSINVGDTSTSIARRGIPKSSTSSIARIASTSSTLPIHRRLNSLASTPPIDLATTPKPAIGGGPLRRIQKESKVEDSPGLDDLVNNTTLAMADIKNMLSPLAVSKVSSNEIKSMSQQQHSSSSINKTARNLKSPPTGGNEEEEEKEELENVNSPSKSALPILQRATSIRKGASSPSPTKISRGKTSTSPRKLTHQPDISIVERPPNRKEGSANANTSAANLTKDGLPALPGTRNLAVPQRPSSSASSVTRPPPSSSSSRYTPSGYPIISSRGCTNATTLNERSTIKLSENTEADVNDEEDFEKLLSEEGFISPARYLTADCSTLLMQDDLEKVMMTPLRAPPPSSRTGRTIQNQSLVLEEGERKDRDVRECEGEEIEKLLQAERERVKKEILAQTAKEREVLEQRVNEEREMIQRQLAEREIELKKQSREITTLQKLLSTQAKSAVIISSLESQLSKQDTDISTIRRLKRDIDESNRSFERERKQMSLEKAKNIWKGYGKEIEIEKESVGCQLETLAGLKGLMDHIALCVERSRRMESDSTRSSSRVAVA